MSESTHFGGQNQASRLRRNDVAVASRWLGLLALLVSSLFFGPRPALTAEIPRSGGDVIPAKAGTLVVESFINAPVEEVWRVFTTGEGYKSLGVAQADVDFRIGGEIRSHYDPKGRLGDAETIVNEILAYEPERMLAIRIKQAPANFPYRDGTVGTWSVIYFNPAGEGVTQVRIITLGYTDTPASQATRKFFERGNRETLEVLGKRYWPKCARCEKEN
jgi:uncharacterized protein YndB with AHSA1/START domain